MHTVWGNSPFCITADAAYVFRRLARAFAENGAVNAVCLYDPSREKAILENPQIFQNCEIINNISADDAQSKAERILNRPAAPLRIKIAIPAAWCYTTYKGRGLAACALCRKI